MQVREITQDHLGFVWLATYDGLVRYDGREFRTFRKDTADPRSLSHNAVWDATEDAAGDIWVATDGGLDVWRRNTESFEHVGADADPSRRLTSQYVRRIIVDGTQGLWIATFGGGLNRMDLRTGRFESLRARPGDPDALSDDRVLEIFRDSRGTIWVGTQAGLNALDPATRRFRVFRHEPGNPRSLAADRVSSIGEDAEGAIWVGTTAGVSRLAPRDGSFESIPFEPGNPAALQGMKVDAILRDRDGYLWFGTDGGGLSRLDVATRTFTHFRHVRGDSTTINSNTIPALFQDRDGDLWVGHWPWGVSYASRVSAAFELVRTIPGQPTSIPDDSIHAIAEDASGVIWVGTDNAGLCRRDAPGKAWTSYLRTPVRSGEPFARAVIALTTDQRGNVWFGSWREGVSRLDPRTGRIRDYRPDPGRPGGLSSGFVLAMAVDRSGTLWVGTSDDGLNRYVPERDGFVQYRRDPSDPNGLNHNAIGSLRVLRSGELWAGTQEGLARWDEAAQRWRRFRCAPAGGDPLGAIFVNDVVDDPAGNLWVATAGGGLVRVDHQSGRCDTISTKEGLPSMVVRVLLLDDEGRLWLGTAGGLVQFDPETRRLQVFDERQGVQGPVFHRGARARRANGELMMGGTGGFNIFDPRKIEFEETFPPVVLTGLDILNRPVRPGPGSLLPQSLSETRRLEIPSSASTVTLYFAALTYRAAARSRLSYQLEGFDSVWQDAGAERRATYTNLVPGTYRFRVRATNGEGQWNPQDVAVDLVILPAWWQTWWFRSGAALGLCLAVIGLTVTASRRRYRAQLLEARRDAALAKERQRVADVIRDSAERLQTAMSAANLGTWDLHLPTGQLVFDPGAAAILGEGSVPTSLQEWSELTHPDDLPAILEQVRRHEAGESERFESEGRHRYAIDRWIWLRVVGRIVERDADGKPVRLSGACLDITERKRAEEQARKLEELVLQSQKIESVGRLAGGVAHDLNNLLTPILGHCELLADELAPDDPRRASVEEMTRAAERSRDLVAQLLAFARKQTLQLQFLDLNDVVRDFELILRRTIRENVRIRYDLEPSLPPIRGDAVQLQQILLNLAVNAQDAMPDGGQLVIGTSRRHVGSEPGEQMDIAVPGDYVVLTVSDTGVGMDKDTQARVFEPFFTTKEVGRGTGLGLATVYGIVKQHGGYTHLYSEPGLGTTLSVYFVAKAGAVVPGESSVAGPEPPTGTETILLVEDQPQVKDLCVRLLAKAGYQVIDASTGTDAIEAAASHPGPIDLLLTDVVLPDLNGRVLYERLSGTREGLRVMYMSGYSADVITHHGVLEEGLIYLQKPFNGDTLKQKIRQALDAPA